MTTYIADLVTKDIHYQDDSVKSQRRLLRVFGPSGVVVDAQNETQLRLDLLAAPGGAHASTHEDGGADEISVTNLSGELADAQKVQVQDEGTLIATRKVLNFIGTAVNAVDNPGAGRVDITISPTGNHASTHENGGADQINVNNLSGELADPQKVTIRVDSLGDVGSRRRLNLIAGTGVSISAVDDGASEEIDITFTSSVTADLPASTYHGQPLIGDASNEFIPADTTTEFARIFVTLSNENRGFDVWGTDTASPQFRTTLDAAALTADTTIYGKHAAYYTPDGSTVYSIGDLRFYHGTAAEDKTVRAAVNIAENDGTKTSAGVLDLGRDFGSYLSVAQATGIRGFVVRRPVDDALAPELIVYDRRSSVSYADGEVLGRLSCWESTDSGATSWRVGAWEFYQHGTSAPGTEVYTNLRLSEPDGTNTRNPLRITADGGIESRRWGEAPINDDPTIGTVLGYFSVTGTDTVRGDLMNGFQVRADQSWGVGNDNVATLQTLIDSQKVQDSVRVKKNITSSTPVVIKSIAVPAEGSLFFNWRLRAKLVADPNSLVDIGGSLLATRDGTADPVIIESAFFPSYAEKGAFNPVPNDETNFTPRVNTANDTIEFIASTKSDESQAAVELDLSWN